jgi:hypothetical protein
VIVRSVKIAAISAIELSAVSTVRIVSFVIMVKIVSAVMSAADAVSCHIWWPRVDNKYLVLRIPRRSCDMHFIMLGILPLFSVVYFRYPNYKSFLKYRTNQKSPVHHQGRKMRSKCSSALRGIGSRTRVKPWPRAVIGSCSKMGFSEFDSLNRLCTLVLKAP